MPDKRQCQSCRFADRDLRPDGSVLQTWCQRYPTTVPVQPAYSCGEWRDATVTPEQEERQVFLKQLVVAMVASNEDISFRKLWDYAAQIADARPED